MTEQIIMLRCPHCTLALDFCLGHTEAMPPGRPPQPCPEPRCQGYVHMHNLEHFCNPANPVYIAENPQEVVK